MKIELELGVWLADGEGDPSRTLDETKAKEFETMAAALAAVKEARRYRPFENAQIHDDFFWWNL